MKMYLDPDILVQLNSDAPVSHVNSTYVNVRSAKITKLPAIHD